MPCVSVVLPVFNAAADLPAALASLKAQTFHDFEAVVVDDASTDATPDVLAAFARGEPRLRVLRQERNTGIVASLNAGLRAARGEFVARQDADDISFPGRLAVQTRVLRERPDVVLVASDYDVVDPEAGLRRVHCARPAEVARFRLLFHNQVGGHSQVMFRRAAALAAGGYDAGYTHAEDYDLWARLKDLGPIEILPFPLVTIRKRPGGLSARFAAEQSATAERIAWRQIATLLARDPEPDSLVAELRAFYRGPFPDPRLAPRLSRALEEILEAHLAGLTLTVREQKRVERLLRRDVARRFWLWSRTADGRTGRLRLAARVRHWDRAIGTGAALDALAWRSSRKAIVPDARALDRHLLGKTTARVTSEPIGPTRPTPMVYAVVSHGNPGQLLRLLRTIRAGSPEATIVVHHDGTPSSLGAAELAGLGPVHLLRSSGPTPWGRWALASTILAVFDWVETHLDYAWTVLLSGQDYPIRPLRTSEAELIDSACDGRLGMEVAVLDEPGTRYWERYFWRQYRPPGFLGATLRTSPGRWLRGRLATALNVPFHWIDCNENGDGSTKILLRDLRSPFAADTVCYKGSAWCDLSRLAVRRLLEAARRQPAVLRALGRAQSASEALVPTLLCNEPGLRLDLEAPRYTDWSQRSWHPKVLTREDLPRILASGRGWARKFDSSIDGAVLDALDEIVLRRL
jgi:Glycosyl transferase family 2/Core-2/I-Branching enzyme